jgi:putative zinc finger/helix-turn-helix YgiT family protein
MKTTRTKRIGKWHLPPECVACGAEDSYKRARTTTEKVCHGEAFRVQHTHWKCENCGVGILGPEEAEEATRATVTAYQQAHGLLTAAELKNARQVAGWSQLDLAERTSLGIATIKRLEGGTTVQTEANDQLLRRVLVIAEQDLAIKQFVVLRREWRVLIPNLKKEPLPIFHPMGVVTPDRNSLEEETLAC